MPRMFIMPFDRDLDIDDVFVNTTGKDSTCAYHSIESFAAFPHDSEFFGAKRDGCTLYVFACCGCTLEL